MRALAKLGELSPSSVICEHRSRVSMHWCSTGAQTLIAEIAPAPERTRGRVRERDEGEGARERARAERAIGQIISAVGSGMSRSQQRVLLAIQL